MPPSVNLNEQFSVLVNASGVDGLYNAVFNLTYDPKKLEVVGQAEGPFLQQGGSQSRFQSFTDRKKGEVWVSQSRVNAVEGASGGGTLVTVVFKTIGKGPAAIGFGNTNFSNKANVTIPVTAFKSVVEVK